MYVSIYLEKGIRMNDTENLLKHINYLCYKFHLFGIIINIYIEFGPVNCNLWWPINAIALSNFF